MNQLDEKTTETVVSHLSKAVGEIEACLAAPLQEMRHSATVLETQGDAFRLILHEQRDLVAALIAATESMDSRQQLHHEQLSSQLDTLHHVQTGLQSVGQELNLTNTNLVTLLHSYSSRSSVMDKAIFGAEHLVFWLFREMEHGFGLDLGNGEYHSDARYYLTSTAC